MNYEEAKVKLKKYGQLHVLDHFEELTDTEKALFLGENAQRFYGFGNLPDLPYIKNMSE